MSRSAFILLLSACVLGALALGLLPYQRVATAQTVGCLPGRPHASGTSSSSITTADGTRTYLLHVPPSYNGGDAVPVIFNFHGLGSNSASQEAYSQFSTLADQASGGFIVVYPQGLTSAAISSTHFNAWQLGSPEPDDVGFTSQLLDTLESQLCIDANRVYSTGMSNGAIMSTRLACSLAAHIAAIAPVAGVYYPADFTELAGFETCPDIRSMPIIAFHGTADNTVPFNGGAGGAGGISVHFRLPIDNNTPDEDVMSDWAAHNNCASGRQESQIDTEVRLVQYGGCDNGTNLELYIVDGGGHTWPGAIDVPGLGYTTHQINATDLIWQFFQRYSLDGSVPADTDGDGIPDIYDPDNDNDGCPDTNELQATSGSERTGGRRDPLNPWDYFNPTHDGKNRVDDILAVIQHYGKDAGDPGYSTDYDRTGIGPNPWNLGPPNGQIRVADIVAQIQQFGHDCV
jgi:poly(3-hydroxybutyrate) depolymerase